MVDDHRKSQDGYLWLRDMYNLKLNSDVVVLCGCIPDWARKSKVKAW
jgi:hypothetical protein